MKYTAIYTKTLISTKEFESEHERDAFIIAREFLGSEENQDEIEAYSEVEHDWELHDVEISEQI